MSQVTLNKIQASSPNLTEGDLVGSGTAPHLETKSATPIEQDTSQEALITGLTCLQPVSEGCISRILRLWQGPPVGTTEPQQNSAETELQLLSRLYLFETMGRELGELLYEGLSRYFSNDASQAPRPPTAECEVRKDAAGEIRVECSAE